MVDDRDAKSVPTQNENLSVEVKALEELKGDY